MVQGAGSIPASGSKNFNFKNQIIMKAIEVITVHIPHQMPVTVKYHINGGET